jgi:flagellar motility protein MotE (MotC chaperone)
MELGGSQVAKKSSEGASEKSAKPIVIFSLILALAIAIACWVYLIRTNKFFGLGEILRPKIKDVPIICNILPPVPTGEEPDLMARDVINKKYTELLNENVELHKKIADLETKVNNLNLTAEKYEIVVKDLEKVSKEFSDLKQTTAEEKAAAQDNSERIANLVKIYESMEAQNAAQILQDIGELNISLVLEICEAMKTAKFSEILQEMDTDFAAILSERMAK